MGVKHKIKEMLGPTSMILRLFRRVKTLAATREFRSIASNEVRLNRAIARSETIETDVLLLCHSLEKGMGTLNARDGFGVAKTRSLIDFLIEWDSQESGKQRGSYAWSEAYQVLSAYFEHSVKSPEILELERCFASLEQCFDENHRRFAAGGYVDFGEEELVTGMEASFEKMLGSRHSVRFFAEGIVVEEKIRKAINMAMASPLACNRQPWRVYYSMDPSTNAQIGELIPGNGASRASIPNYMVVTCDRKYFKNFEAFQWYLNGGIFLGYLTLALHSLDLGSSLYQWPTNCESDSDMRKLVGVESPTEVVVCTVGFGNYLPQNRCLCAERRPLNEVAIRIP